MALRIGQIVWMKGGVGITPITFDIIHNSRVLKTGSINGDAPDARQVADLMNRTVVNGHPLLAYAYTASNIVVFAEIFSADEVLAVDFHNPSGRLEFAQHPNGWVDLSKHLIRTSQLDFK